MKKLNKVSYEKMLEIFDNTHSICTWENILKWREELKKNGWTDEEFDAELSRRALGKTA